jgi:hypothetical protein
MIKSPSGLRAWQRLREGGSDATTLSLFPMIFLSYHGGWWGGEVTQEGDQEGDRVKIDRTR